MTPQQWIAQLSSIVDKRDWEALRAFQTQANQALVADPEATRQFYREVVELGLPPDKQAHFINPDMQAFAQKIQAALVTVAEKVKADPGIKGVYFEYVCTSSEPDDDSNGNFFLCRSFSEDEDEWGSDFDRDGVVLGARLPDFKYFDPEYEWEDRQRMTGDEVANGLLMACVVEQWQQAGIANMPFGFADHDNAMVRIPV